MQDNSLHRIASVIENALSSLYMGFPCGSASKESTCNAGDLGSIPGLGRSPGKGKGYPLQYSGLENSMDCIVHGVSKSQTRLSDFHFSSSPEWVANHTVTCVCDILPDGLRIAGVSHNSGILAPPCAPTYPQHIS